MKKLQACLLIMAISTICVAQPQISGPQSGTLGPGTYLVVGDIQVLEGDSLEIIAGTTFLHNESVKWEISGYFTADGAEGDSIYFIIENAINGWGGLRFLNRAPAAVLDYCIVDHCYLTDLNGNNGGIYVAGGAGITLTNSRVSNCYSQNWGSGVYAYNAAVFIDNCAIVNNYVTSHPKGTGIFLENCNNAQILNSTIAYNYGDGM